MISIQSDSITVLEIEILHNEILAKLLYTNEGTMQFKSIPETAWYRIIILNQY